MAGFRRIDVLQTLLENTQISAYDVGRCQCEDVYPDTGRGDFATSWRKALHDGWVEGTAFTAKAGGAGKSAVTSLPRVRHQLRMGLRFRSGLILRSMTAGSPMLAGCRSLPKQVTNLSWDNAAIMSIEHDGRSEARGVGSGEGLASMAVSLLRRR